MEDFSFFNSETSELIEYELINPKSEEVSKVIEKGRSTLAKDAIYGWCKDELVLYNPLNKKITISL